MDNVHCAVTYVHVVKAKVRAAHLLDDIADLRVRHDVAVRLAPVEGVLVVLHPRPGIDRGRDEPIRHLALVLLPSAALPAFSIVRE